MARARAADKGASWDKAQWHGLAAQYGEVAATGSDKEVVHMRLR